MKERLPHLFALAVLLALLLSSCAPAATPAPPPPPTKEEAKPTEPPAKEAWSLAKAAEPWKGETLRLIGEALPPAGGLGETQVPV